MKTPFQIDAEGIAAVDRGETVAWDVALQRIDAAIERGATMRRKMQIAIAASGDIHIWLGHKMPTAANLVEIELERDGDMYVVPADKAGPLRELLGTGEVAAQVCVRGHSRLQRVLAMAETLVDEIRAEIDGDIDPLVEFSEGLMSKEAAVKALGLRDYAQLLVALGDRGLPLPKLPEHVLEPMIENLVKIMKDDDDQPAPPGM